MAFRPPDHLILHETEHWILNHRVDASLPGYLMLGARAETNKLYEMPAAALAEMGVWLARAQQALAEVYAPPHLYISRYGHMAGFSIHFHIVPVHKWVLQRYLQDVGTWDVSGRGASGSDGSDITRFIWPNYCEKFPCMLPVEESSVPEAMERLRHWFARNSMATH
jgi:diadenosine tetraphosphate (Ap4A) HIT family hydrolase